MPAFQAINAPLLSSNASPELPVHDANNDHDEGLTAASTFRAPSTMSADPRPSVDEPRSDIRDRRWDVARIIGKRKVNGELEWLITWQQCTLLAKNIHRPRGRPAWVRCAGQDWYIRNDYPALPSSGGALQRTIEWEDTWRKHRDLAKDSRTMWESIEEFESGNMEEANIEVNPVANSEVNSETSSEETSVPASMHIVLRPKKDTNHSQELRAGLHKIHRDRVPASQRRVLLSLMDSVPVRPLIFRDAFVHDNNGLDLINTEDRRINAMLVYDTAAEQSEPCDRCRRDLGPFPSCVVDMHFNRGACASCVFSGNATLCNFNRACRPPIQDRTPGESFAGRTPRSSETASPATTTLSTINTSFHSSPEPPQNASQDTSPTSPAGATPAQCAPNRIRGSSIEKREDLPRLAQLQRELDEGLFDRARQISPSLDHPNALIPLSSSQLNVRSAANTIASRHKRSCNLASDESRSTRAIPESRKRKRSQTPPERLQRSSLKAELPLVEDIDFRHERCIGAGTPCVDAPVGYGFIWGRAGPFVHPDVVYRQTRFYEGEATEGQVRFIISRCPCAYAAHFQEAWEDYCAVKTSNGRPINHTKERFLSKGFSGDINGVVNAFCPNEPTGEGSADLPIIIDD